MIDEVRELRVIGEIVHGVDHGEPTYAGWLRGQELWPGAGSTV